MKKVVFSVLSALLFCGTVSAAYQVYDVKLTLNTTGPMQISLPYPLNVLFESNLFRQRTKETLSGMVVCWGSDQLSNPSFMYLRSLGTGKTYQLGRTLAIDWPVYNRLSPNDNTVECAWELRLSVGSGDGYFIVGGGTGKTKTLKYTGLERNTQITAVTLDAFKGELAGYKTISSSHGVSVDGAESMGSSQTAIYGSWQIKLNKKYTDAIYRLSAGGNSGSRGEELTAEAIASALGL